MVIQPNENNEFLGCLSTQAKDLKNAQKRLDIPAWVAVTSKGRHETNLMLAWNNYNRYGVTHLGEN
jgi:hypothetical protein